MSARPRVVVIASRPSAVEPLVQPAAEKAEFIIGLDEALLWDAMPSAEVVFVWDYRTDLLRRLWSQAWALRWVHVSAAGVDAVLFPELVDSSVMLTNSRGVFDDPVAEYGLALMLFHSKRLGLVLEQQREAHWRHWETEELAGKTLAILGMGAIGSKLARKAEALGMRVVGVRRSGDSGVAERRARLHGALEQADYVVIILPLTPETRGLIGSEELATMKRTAYLINLGRGGIVDEQALYHALEDGIIAGAALDVFEQEPLPPTHPLWIAPNMLVSPHMAGESTGWQRRVIDLFLENLDRYRHGAELLNVVDKRRGY